MTRRKFLLFGPALLVFISLAVPGRALAHGGTGETAPMAAPLSWGFLVFGILVIGVMSAILFRGQTGGSQITAADFEGMTGFQGYIAKMRLFSRNARLFILHVVGMDVIYGTWTVIFNLYLLGIGFDIAFVGLRILLQTGAMAVFSIPAGLISDRVGRKLSFILGDGGGAVMSLIAISTASPTLLLLTGGLSGIFNALHGVAEPAFMAENSQDYERVHLFSVSTGTRIAAAIIGSALAGLVPLLFAGGDHAAVIGLYRWVAYAGIAGWFASLIPALMLTQVSTDRIPVRRLADLFAGVRHPDRIWKLTSPEVILALGAGFALPLLNVFFRENLGSEEVEIGATFAAGQAFLVVAALLVPIVAAWLGKVRAVVFTRLLAVPFILLIAFSTDVGGSIGAALTLAGVAHIARITFANMGSPVRSAFAMEILAPSERGTQVGLEMAFAAGLSGLASYLGAQLMEAGNFSLPFVLMAVFTLAGTLLFWRFFAGWETERLGVSMPEGVGAAD